MGQVVQGLVGHARRGPGLSPQGRQKPLGQDIREASQTSQPARAPDVATNTMPPLLFYLFQFLKLW